MQTFVHFRLPLRLALAAALPVLCTAAEVRGTVTDPSGAAIPAAEVSAVSRVGLLARTQTDRVGAWELRAADLSGAALVVTAAGFETRRVPLEGAGPFQVQLSIAPQVDSVAVVGSTIDVPMSEQGSSASLVPREEIARRNEPLMSDLLRYVPGISVTQAGPRGAATSAYVRGGEYSFNLVQIDGVTVNAFGGAFDFAHIPASSVERIEVARGPQSAIYGAYANSAAINIVTREPGEGFTLDLTAEGGTYQERRFVVGSSGTVKGLGLSVWLSSLDSDGPVPNSDYTNRNVAFSAGRGFGRQRLDVHGFFVFNEVGAPGPWGSDPLGFFSGIDTYSRNKNNFSSYLAHYQADIGARVRQELSGSFFLNNQYYRAPMYLGGDSWNKDLRGQAESRTLVSVLPNYTTSFGFAWTREDENNSWITDAAFNTFPLRRHQAGIYWENRFDFGRRLFLNAGARAEVIRTSEVPAAPPARPTLPVNTLTRVNPKVAAAYGLTPSTRVHGSFGSGIRPPGGWELAFTDNPGLRPERTMSFDAGIEQRLAANRVALDATYFYSRFADLIVTLGGPLQPLSEYRSDNLSNSMAQGAELGVRVQPSRSVALRGTYTYLDTELLSLDGSTSLAPQYFRVGQQLIRRPRHSGAAVASYSRGRIYGDVTGYFRGATLDTEPNMGAYGGLFRNPGYFVMGVNLNCRVAEGATVYGHLRNAFNRRYEEIFGYPSPLLNFVVGMKFTLARGK
jgi:outer membrane cobalamin receptor